VYNCEFYDYLLLLWSNGKQILQTKALNYNKTRDFQSIFNFNEFII